jgi:hypothetical protein
LRVWQERQKRGRPMINDQERIALMALHLVGDPDLIERQRQGESGTPPLRASPGANDLYKGGDKAGQPTASAVRRLVRKFPYFRWNDPKRGWNRGLWS